MKFLLVFAVVLIGFYIWRSSRVARKPPPKPPGAEAPRMIEMVRCDVCGVHCPKSEAVVGRLGVYCGAQHHRQAEP